MPLKEFLQENYGNLDKDNEDGCGTRLFVGTYKEPIGDCETLFANFIDKEKHLFTKGKLDRVIILELALIFSRLEVEVLKAALDCNLNLNPEAQSKLRRAYFFAFITQFNAYTISHASKAAEIGAFMQVLHTVAETVGVNMQAEDLVSKTRETFDKAQKAFFPQYQIKTLEEAILKLPSSGKKEDKQLRSKSSEAHSILKKTEQRSIFKSSKPVAEEGSVQQDTKRNFFKRLSFTTTK